RESPEQIADRLTQQTRLADPATRKTLLDGGAAAIEASNDPLLVFARILDKPARAVRADYENNVKAVVTKNAALIARAKFGLEGTS
ncbi:S46 family peptidase, partial [Vibrio parahaemolyticus]